MVPAGPGDQDCRKEADEEIMGGALQTRGAGQDYMRGIQSILNSIEKEPLILWRKEVSVNKTISSIGSHAPKISDYFNRHYCVTL